MKHDDPQTPAHVGPKRGQLGAVDALAQLSFLVHGAIGKVGAEHDLSVIQMRLLGVLRDRSPGMNELARYLELDKSSISGLVDRAEQRGLVRRKPSSSDRRGIDVSITPAGRKLIQLVEAKFEERIRSSRSGPDGDGAARAFPNWPAAS